MDELTQKYFHNTIDRKSSGAMKWQQYGENIIPLWVADSDFKCAKPIQEALRKSVEHGIYGYHLPNSNERANQAVIDWLRRRHNWAIKAEWLVWLPGVVPAFNLACKTFSRAGDKVLVQSPNYKPLLLAPAFHGLTQELVNTVLVDGRWQLDFEQLEQKASDPSCSLFLLCNPMNPCGTVYSLEELRLIEEICLKHNVSICADEIHCDLVLDETKKHIPLGKLPHIGEQSITIMAANKTFNIAGLSSAFAIIPDKKIRGSFQRAALGMVPWANFLGVEATAIAFSQCDDWYDAQLKYLRANQAYLSDAINAIPGLSYQPSAATFLAWVDASGLKVADVQQYMLKKQIAPSSGNDFGWPNFSRLNFACSRALLKSAIKRLA